MIHGEINNTNNKMFDLLSQRTMKKKFNCIFPTRYVFPESLFRLACVTTVTTLNVAKSHNLCRGHWPQLARCDYVFECQNHRSANTPGRGTPRKATRVRVRAFQRRFIFCVEIKVDNPKCSNVWDTYLHSA